MLKYYRNADVFFVLIWSKKNFLDYAIIKHMNFDFSEFNDLVEDQIYSTNIRPTMDIFLMFMI